MFKTNAALQNGLTMIPIPCWWNGDKESLEATIHFHRPDLIVPSIITPPISLNPPDHFFLGGWEKNMMALGVAGTSFTRHGKVIPVHDSFVRFAPKIFIDCELWFGRGQFGDTYKLATSASNDLDSKYDHYSPELALWSMLRWNAFDTPDSALQVSPFEVRYEQLLLSILSTHPFSTVVPRVLCTGSSHLNYFTQSIIDHDGEGVIVRLIRSQYEHGRNSSLVKLKTSAADAEAVVTGFSVDSLHLKLYNGTVFEVPWQSVRISKPSIGDIVSFTSDSSARIDPPLRPIVYRIRNDLSWEEVVQNTTREKQYLNESSGFTAKPIGHWNSKNMRLFLEKFARSKGLDPLLPDTWYSIPAESIRKTKGGSAILGKFRGGYLETLLQLFPDIGLSRDAYHKNMWQSIEKRRKFFEKYAHHYHFDPLIPENWYSIARASILTFKGARRVLSFHKGRLSQALLDLFPNIGLEKSKLRSFYYRYTDNRKFFFQKYAQANQFDALIPAMWYLQPISRILSFKDAREVISYHKGSVPRALLDLFPDIGLDDANFSYAWVDEENRRAWFEKYAEDNAFDPLQPHTWYSHDREHIMASDGIRRVLSYHQGSIATALHNLFPDVLFDPLILHLKYSDMHLIKNRAKFFEDYANSNKIDILNPLAWRQHSHNIKSTPGSLSKALRHLCFQTLVQTET